MRWLPWKISKRNSTIIIDSRGAVAVNLSKHFVTGQGHNPVEIAQFLVSRSCDLAEQESKKKKKKTTLVEKPPHSDFMPVQKSIPKAPHNE